MVFLRKKILRGSTYYYYVDKQRLMVNLLIKFIFFVRDISNKLNVLNITDERIFEELSKIRVDIVSGKDLKKPEVIVEPMSTT